VQVDERLVAICDPMSAVYTSMIRRSRSMRSRLLVAEKAGKERRAAATARSTSALLPSAIVAIGCSVAGLITSSVAVPSGSTHSPPM